MRDGLRRCLVIAALGTTLLMAHPSPALAAVPAPSPSPDAPLIPLPAPGRPVASDLTPTGVTLSWTSTGPVFRYSVQRLVDGQWQPFDATNRPVAQFTRLTSDTEYTFRVTAHALPNSGYTTSPPSETVTFRTPRPGEPAAPTIPGTPELVASTATSMTLRWAPALDDTGVSRYVLAYTDLDVATVSTAHSATTTATITGLLPGHRYAVTVRAVDTTGNSSPPSASLLVALPTVTLTCRLEVTEWSGGFLVVGSLHNPGNVAVTGWTVTVTLPTEAGVTGGWNAVSSSNGPVVSLTPTAWTRTIASGATTTFGLYGWQTGGLDGLAGALDGTPCGIVRRTAAR